MDLDLTADDLLRQIGATVAARKEIRERFVEIETPAKQLRAELKALENRGDYLKDRLKAHLEANGQTRADSWNWSAHIRKNAATVVITDPEEVANALRERGILHDYLVLDQERVKSSQLARKGELPGTALIVTDSIVITEVKHE